MEDKKNQLAFLKERLNEAIQQRILAELAYRGASTEVFANQSKQQPLSNQEAARKNVQRLDTIIRAIRDLIGEVENESFTI